MTGLTEDSGPCLNCGFMLGGEPCCAHCGQRHRPGRLSLRDLVQDIYTHVLEWDLPWLLTLKTLTLNPGQAALDYIHGKRARYVNPVKYLFYLVGFLALLATLGGSANDEYLLFFAGALDDALARGELADMPRVLQFLLNHSALLLLLYAPLVALAFQAVHVRSGRNVVETACFVAYLVGHLALFLFVMAVAGELLATLGTPLILDALLWFAGFVFLLLYITRASMVFFGAGLAYSFCMTVILFIFLFVLLRLIPVWLVLLYST